MKNEKLNETLVLVREVLFIIACLSVSALVVCLVRQCVPERPTFDEHTAVTDSIRVDTFFLDKPVPVREGVVGVIKLGKGFKDLNVLNDSTSQDSDSVALCLPITQKEYVDSTYHAWVSGYDASLDSIEVYQREHIRTVVHTLSVPVPSVKKRRVVFGPAVGLGYGLTTGRPDFFVGVTLTVSL